MEALGVTALEIPIEKAVRQHFLDIGQDENVHDVTYENSQARERTQILMDYANKWAASCWAPATERGGAWLLHL